MTREELLAQLHAANAEEVKLPRAGMVATVRYPDSVEAIVAGGLNLAILGKLRKAAQAMAQATDDDEAGETAKEVPTEQMDQMLKFRSVMVRLAVTKLDGEDITLTDEDVAAMHTEDRQAIWDVIFGSEGKEGEPSTA